MTDASPIVFWIFAIAMVGIAVAIVVPRLLSGGARREGPSRRALNVDVYRGQLADLARDRADGALEPADYERQRAELERRLLEEGHDEAAPPGRSRTRLVAWIVALALPAGAFGIYELVGSPAALDPAQLRDAAEDPAAYRASLEKHLARNPGDARAWVMLGRSEMEADRFAEAAQAFDKAIAASPRVARDPEVLTELADALGMAQQGLAGRPSELIDRALAIAPEHPKALEMAGSAAFDRGDFARAAVLWRQLQKQYASGTRPWVELGGAIARAEAMAASAPPPAGAGKPGS